MAAFPTWNEAGGFPFICQTTGTNFFLAFKTVNVSQFTPVSISFYTFDDLSTCLFSYWHCLYSKGRVQEDSFQGFFSFLMNRNRKGHYGPT